MSELRSSKLEALVALAGRLRGEPLTAELANLGTFRPLALTWSRNRVSEADTCEVELLASEVPFDLRVLAPRGGILHTWLFEHQQPQRCRPGDAGHFVGVIDDIQRSRDGNRISIRARDMSSLLLDTTIGEGRLRQISFANSVSLASVVQQLLSFLDGAADWTVEERTTLASSPVALPEVRPRKAAKGTVGPAPKNALRVRYRHMASVLPGQGDVSIWAAIVAVCARMGVMPEVMTGRDGKSKVVLSEAADVHMSAVLRPFQRVEDNGKTRNFRVITDGLDVAELDERLELTTHAQRPDFVQVASVDRETGKKVIGEWPQKRPRQNENGVFQVVEGLATNADAQRLARVAWDALAQNEMTVNAVLPHPWTTGGGPDEPDLLDCAAGAAIEVRFRGLDSIDATAPEVLRARGVDPEVVRRITAAMSHLGRLSMLFRVDTVEHRWAGGSSPEYRCSLQLRQFLGAVGA